ncbi:MAG TPA: fumarylacetoacetate hydrolase family protein [Rhodoblastus sp.]|nr:fumarylacetoacetate hydrolase family protein [Rhodoblastus sp.]
MKLLTFSDAAGARIGLLEDDETIVDLSVAAPRLPRDMLSFLEGGEALMNAARAASGSAAGRLRRPDVTIESPLRRPPKILATGMNYSDHLIEVSGPDAKPPERPVFFNKQSTSARAPYASIMLPPESEQLDYEAELAIVIGRRCRRVRAADAHRVIAGYTILNDVSVRDWQRMASTTTMGKSWDTHCPMGPAIVTADEIPDPVELDIRTFVNGELRQSSNTRNLIFDCRKLIEALSTVFTLEPGDVIATGTPGGVAAFRPQKDWLKADDVVRVEIERIGHIEARIEPDSIGSFIQ